MEPPSSYVDIELLECNRLASDDARYNVRTDTNATWKTKLGNTVILNPRDTIQMSSAYISEVGAADVDALEIKGTSLGVDKKFIFSEVDNQYIDAQYVTGFGRQNYKNASKTIELRDNEANLLIDYYTNSNLENYIHLPRRYGLLSASKEVKTTIPAHLWNGINGEDEGACAETVPGWPYRVYGDYRPYGDYMTETESDTNAPRQKSWNDGSRFTIYVREKSTFNYKAYQDGNASDYHPLTYGTDMARNTYLKYTELLTLKVDSGFNTPSDIAEQLTRQMREATISSVNVGANASSVGYDNLTTRVVSKTYKPFNCAAYSLFTSDNFYKANAIDGQNIDSQEYWDWHNNFQFIGVKRPELWEAGRAINKSDAKIDQEVLKYGTDVFEVKSDFSLNPLSDHIETTMAWNSSNLNNIKKLFEAQTLYPELWENFDPENPDYGVDRKFSRYLHLNVSYDNLILGSDHLDMSFDDIPTWKNGDYNASATVPLWIKYQPENKDYFIEDPTSSDKLIYGFALKTYAINGSGIKVANISLKIGCSQSYAETAYKNKPSETITYTAHGPQTQGLPVIILNMDATHPVINLDNLTVTISNASLTPNPVTVIKATAISPTTQELVLDGTILHSMIGGEDIDVTFSSAIKAGTKMGYDWHFNSFGTKAVIPWQGLKPKMSNSSTANGNQIFSSVDNEGEKTIPDVFSKVNQTYIGANLPSVLYDTDDQRFNINGLHTSEVVGQDVNAGDLNASLTQPINPQANQSCYKMNKVPWNYNWSPEIGPYNKFTEELKLVASGVQQYFKGLPEPLYNMVKPWQIMDAQSGIYINDFGFTKDTWGKSLWGIMGFSYEQFNTSISASNNSQARIDGRNELSLNRVTTNSEVITSDVNIYSQNIFGSTMNCPNLSFPQSALNACGTEFSGQGYPLIVQNANSINIRAQNLPRRTLKPYYCVRSNIISQTKFIGGEEGGLKLPIVGVINKVNPSGDFFTETNSDLIFTVTQRMLLSDIDITITDPDGTYANCNEDSSIIFKITKNIEAEFDVVQQMLLKNQPKKK